MSDQDAAISNGGFQTRGDIENGLSAHCDFVAISRPLLANLDLVEQFKSDQALNEPANPCSWCSLCCTRTAVLPLGCYDIGRFGGKGDPTAQDKMERQILELSAGSSP